MKKYNKEKKNIKPFISFSLLKKNSKLWNNFNYFSYQFININII